MRLSLAIGPRQLRAAAAALLLAGLAACQQQPMGDDPETARLVKQLHADHPTWSKFAAFQLAEQGDPRAVPKLRELLRSDDEGDRWMAIRALPGIDDHRVPKLLIEAARREAAEALRISAVQGLARFAARPEAAEFLLEGARERDALGAECIDALGAGRAPVGRQLAELYAAEGGDAASHERRLRLIRALGGAGDRAARRTLEGIVASGSQELTDAARAALAAAQPLPATPASVWVACCLMLAALAIASALLLRMLTRRRRTRPTG